MEKIMSRKCLPTLFLCAFALGASLAQDVSAQQFTSKPYADVGGWKVRKILADGQKMNCEAVAPGADFAAFSLSSEGCTLQVKTQTKGDAPVKGVIVIDAKSSNVSFERFEGNKLGLFLKPAQLKAIRSAKKLTVKAGNETTSFALDGAGPAMAKAKACNDAED